MKIFKKVLAVIILLGFLPLVFATIGAMHPKSTLYEGFLVGFVADIAVLVILIGVMISWWAVRVLNDE